MDDFTGKKFTQILNQLAREELPNQSPRQALMDKIGCSDTIIHRYFRGISLGGPSNYFQKLLTVLLKDGTADGNSKVAQQVRDERLGEKIQLHRILKAFEKEGFSRKDIQAVKADVKAALDAGEYEARIVRKQLLPSSSMDDKLSEDLKSGLHWGREKMLRKIETLEQLPTERQEQGFIELKGRAQMLLSKL